jgi:hypothetical protein
LPSGGPPVHPLVGSVVGAVVRVGGHRRRPPSTAAQASARAAAPDSSVASLPVQLVTTAFQLALARWRPAWRTCRRAALSARCTASCPSPTRRGLSIPLPGGLQGVGQENYRLSPPVDRREPSGEHRGASSGTGEFGSSRETREGPRNGGGLRTLLCRSPVSGLEGRAPSLPRYQPIADRRESPILMIP